LFGLILPSDLVQPNSSFIHISFLNQPFFSISLFSQSAFFLNQPFSSLSMSTLDSIVLSEKRPKFLRVALTLVYGSFLVQGIGGMIVAIATGIPWVIGVGCLVSLLVLWVGLYLLKMNRDPELTLTPTGFSERTETDYRKFNWSDVEGFEVYQFYAQHQLQTRVGFNFSLAFRRSRPYKKVRLSANAQRCLTGFAWSLSNCYGKDPKELAALLNHYHRAATH
jgi:hypothetical protein